MKRVLVVGSSEEGDRICETFRSIHADALSFLSPEALLTEVDKETPHLVIVAFEIASKSDLTIQELRKMPALRSIPVIVFYPSFTMNADSRAIQAGANDAALFPLDRRDLLVRSARLLRVEKRRAFKTLLTVEAVGRSVMAQSEDFSPTGLSFVTDEKLEEQETLRIHVFLPGNSERITLPASVARRMPMLEGKYLYGAQFTEADSSVMGKIEEFIDRGR